MAYPGRDDGGRFASGNRLWEVRSSAGPKPKFDDPDVLWAACCEYFDWVSKTPLWEDRLVTFQGTATHEPVAKMRAMTIAGMCLFLDIGTSTWDDWKKTRTDLSEVVSRAEQVIRTQKFEGAAADLLNPNIIARDIGLADRTEHTGRDGGPIEHAERSNEEMAKAIVAILSESAA